MKIDTKLNIGDECFYLKDNKVVQDKIMYIRFEANVDTSSLKYGVALGSTILDINIAPTKHDLLKLL